MGKPVNGDLSGGRPKTGVCRALRRRLAATTILAVAPFLGYGRQANAACMEIGATAIWECGGANAATQTINDSDADVSTLPGFSVNAAAGNGIEISGDGHLQFTDENASPITGNDDGLYVHSTGNSAANDGAITIITNGNITGNTANGIYADNDGGGSLTITADGHVTGNGADGIFANLGSSGDDLTITTGTASTVTGGEDGIDARNYGEGNLSIDAEGEVLGQTLDGINAYNFRNGADLVITAGAGSAVSGADDGIQASNYGNGNLTIAANGTVTGENGTGISARNFYGELYNPNTYTYDPAYGVDLRITAGAQSIVRGGNTGIVALNLGKGYLAITANGEVTGYGGDGIYAKNDFTARGYAAYYGHGTDLTITTGPASVITGWRNGIVALNYGFGNLTITANGEVTGQAGSGIFALNHFADGAVDPYSGYKYYTGGVDLSITTGSGSIVVGGIRGITAINNGSGNLRIDVGGEVTGGSLDGIYALNGRYADDLIITTRAGSIVTGTGGNGLRAYNYGGGNLEVTVEGEVHGGADHDGIKAYNSASGADLIITTDAGSAVAGGDDGIEARNHGAGNLEIIVEGTVTGDNAIGISATNVYGEDYNPYSQKTYYSYGIDLIITTSAASVVTGAGYGILANNLGTGNLEIDVGGEVMGENFDGIYALNGEYAGDLTITTGGGSAVTGSEDGIDARNHGEGDLSIEVNGAVTGNDDGIYAKNGVFFYGGGVNLTIETGAESVSTGSDDGIDANNYGSGNLTITANGTVTGRYGNGVEAYSAGGGTNLKVAIGAAGVIKGNENGIAAYGFGDGTFEITADGEVTGANEDGIYAVNGAAGDTSIDVGATGLVQGANASIHAHSVDGQSISITNDGFVRNLSTESDDLAIITYGGATDIENNGVLIGTVSLSSFGPSYDGTLDNNGYWNTANGDNDFGGADDEVTNRGTLIAADDGTLLEETRLFNLEEFNNDGGLVSLADGQEGDVLNLSGEVAGGVEYIGTGGRLTVDAVLGPQAGPGSLSDLLRIDGNTDGTTLVHVNVVDVTGANLDGIPVVIVNAGTTAEEHFDLDGPLSAGFFAWDLRLDDNGVSPQHELFTSGVGVGSYELAAGIGGAQEVWRQTTGTVLLRQADLRVLLDGTSVTPVADYAEPVAPTPVAHVTPGLWLKGVGAYVEQDDGEDGFTLDREQTIWGGLAGFDFGSEGEGSAWLFGLFGGYLTSDLEFDETNTEWTYEGPTVGAYVTYLAHAFYADLTVKADFLDIEIDPEDLAPGSDDADTDALNIGGRLDTGYKFGKTFFIEPQATLSVVHTEIDDVDIFGGNVDFDDETSVRGRLGLRLGFDQPDNTGTVYSGDVTGSVWEEFNGDNGVSITDPTFGTFGASDDAGGTYGDVSVGFAAAAPEGWSGFLRGNYLFGNNYEAITGNAGVRFAW